MFGRFAEKRTISSLPWMSGPSDPWGGWPGDNYGPTSAGVNVDSGNATQLLTVYSCVALISDAIGTLPIDTYRARPDGSKDELALPYWISKPAEGLDTTAWLSQILTSLLLDGNAYLGIRRQQDTGRVDVLMPLDPCVVKVYVENGNRVVYVNGRVPSYDILHIPAIMRAGAVVGMSPVEAARQTIGAGMAVQDFAGRFFSQGATMSGVIESPMGMPPEGPGSAKEMAKSWARSHSGRSKAHLPGVLTGGATWKPTSVTNEQAQFLQTRQFTAAEIAGQMFHIDPTNLGIPVLGTSLVYGNLEQRKSHLVTFALMPWIVRLERAFSSLLASPQYVKFNTDAFLRGDTKTRFETYQIGIASQIITPNEARELEDLPPLDGGDTVVTPAAPPAMTPASGANGT